MFDVMLYHFQYDGEIQVLSEVTIINTLTNKKWSGKDLPIRAGEKLDVIVKAVDNKLICRNEEGKCEYRLFMFGYDNTKSINILILYTVKKMFGNAFTLYKCTLQQ